MSIVLLLLLLMMMLLTVLLVQKLQGRPQIEAAPSVTSLHDRIVVGAVMVKRIKLP
jgi:hypothetical protein